MWHLLKYLPESFLTYIKNNTNSQLRFWIRQKFGADFTTIPDKIIDLKDGRKFHVTPDDAFYWPIYYGLGYEPEVTGIVSKIIKSGDTVLDVGANVGWFTTLFGKLVGPNGRVIGFEPVPYNFERLSEHIDINFLKNNTELLQVAVGKESGTADIHIFENRTKARSSLSSLNETSNFVKIPVSLVSLDDVLSERGISSIALMKVDVEGAEYGVLLGASKLLSAHDAPIVITEINNDVNDSFGYKASDIKDLLENYGYRYFYSITSANKIKLITSDAAFNQLANVTGVEEAATNTQLKSKSIIHHFEGVPGMAICSKKEIVI